MTRRGYEEETWWDFAYSPVRDEQSNMAGLLNVTSDSTGRVLPVLVIQDEPVLRLFVLDIV